MSKSKDKPIDDKCTCTVNTPELYYHYPDCPYRKHIESTKKEENKRND